VSRNIPVMDKSTQIGSIRDRRKNTWEVRIWGFESTR